MTDIDFAKFEGHSAGPWITMRDPCHFDSMSDVYTHNGKRVSPGVK